MMLDGLRVLDIAGRSGAFCARILADLGADVVRMAFADEDDESARPPFVGEASVYDVALNANKRIVLEYGRTPYGDLTRRADVIVQTRHQVRGIHYRYEDIAYRNPRGVLVTITPYGTSGPLADAAASDLEVTAASGSFFSWRSIQFAASETALRSDALSQSSICVSSTEGSETTVNFMLTSSSVSWAWRRRSAK